MKMRRGKCRNSARLALRVVELERQLAAAPLPDEVMADL